ncbi:MAG: stage V sporulation protein SpoVM [Ruminococcus sp.]|nr:stage V sporulation protein SpoVM [Ruminococcus sp.]MBQ2093920.1 stage V sporulation protein SpoVM [Ruminococcus sp.]MBQ7745106.1 stage V sporulation protein SpoVM [Ruminococcus sp.]
MPQTKGKIRRLLRRRLACRVAVAAKMGVGCRGSRACNSQLNLYQEVTMKVILIENPRFISAILRKIYGIKKVK